jgi:glycosyltransferase involved in cell wall biosynthesis
MVYGGASLGTFHLAERVAPGVFHSTVICGLQSENEGKLFDIMQKRRVTVIMIPEMVREINPLKDFVTLMKLTAIIKKYRYDIVHVHGSKAGAIGRLAAAIARVPVILYTVHGWGLKAGIFASRVVFRSIERAVSHLTTKILFQTQSDMDEAYVHKIGSRKQYVLIGNGIDLEAFLNYNRERSRVVRRELGITNRKVVGTVGRVSEQKNPIGFIKIATQVLKQRQDVVFIFIGGGELLHSMRDKVRQAGLSKNILFIGPRDDVAEIVADFDIFILPSLWEGMPRSVIEAMVLSKPVVVHDIGGIHEIVQDNDNGFIIPVDQHREFAERILHLLRDENLCMSVGREARKTAKRYDFNKVIRKTESIYTELMSIHTRR